MKRDAARLVERVRQEWKTKRLPAGVIAGALLLHLLPFAVRPAIIGGDEPHYALAAHSIATDLDLRLEDEYEAVEDGASSAGRKQAGEAIDRHLRTVNGRTVSVHPLGLPALAAAPLAIQQALLPGSPPDLLLGLMTVLLTFFSLLALAKLVWIVTDDPRFTGFAIFAVWFASPVWFYGRTFFTEPYIVAWSVLAVVALFRGSFVAAAACVFLALAMKEMSLLIAFPLMIGAAAYFGRRAAGAVAAGAAAFALAFVTKNLLVYGEPLTTFQPYQVGSLIEGIAGLSISESKGLLWFAPMLALAPAGWASKPEGRGERILSVTSAAAFGSWFIVTAGWVDWGGGSCWGPRLLVPVLPTLVIPLYLLYRRIRGGWMMKVAWLLCLAGFGVGWSASVDPFTAFWNATPGALFLKNLPIALSGVAVGAVIVRKLALLPTRG